MILLRKDKFKIQVNINCVIRRYGACVLKDLFVHISVCYFANLHKGDC